MSLSRLQGSQSLTIHWSVQLRAGTCTAHTDRVPKVFLSLLHLHLSLGGFIGALLHRTSQVSHVSHSLSPAYWIISWCLFLAAQLFSSLIIYSASRPTASIMMIVLGPCLPSTHTAGPSDTTHGHCHSPHSDTKLSLLWPLLPLLSASQHKAKWHNAC